MAVMPNVVVDGLTVRRGGTIVLDDESVVARAGRITAIIGPSGSGKTSLIRAIARLDPAEQGTIRFDGRDMTRQPPGVGASSLTFQKAALLGHRTVAGNVSFPLELRRVLEDEIEARVGGEAQALRIVRLLDRRASQLSVGEAHVVQLARALVGRPELLLLDEPFAAVDAERAAVLRLEVRMLQQWFGATVIVATNDPDDARRFADDVVVLEAGRLVQVGSARDVYERPDTVVAAQITGDASVDVVTVERADEGWSLVLDGVRVRAWAPVLARHVGRRLQMVTRPEWWELDDRGTVVGTVTRAPRWSGDTTLTVDVDGHSIAVGLPPGRGRSIEHGDPVRLRLSTWVLIDPLDGRRIDTGG